MSILFLKMIPMNVEKRKDGLDGKCLPIEQLGKSFLNHGSDLADDSRFGKFKHENMAGKS